MAYLANHGYKNDVFVSYAHADNAPRLESKIQWVSDLVVELQTVLSQKLKNKEGQKPHIWIDHELAKNIPLTQSLKEEIRQTATYIIVMSPAYIDSVWCKTERQEFFSILNEKGASTRVFIIEIDEINRKEYPIEINEHVVPYTFWKKDVHSKARLLGFPKKEEDIDYSNKLNDVCYDLARELEKIKKAEAAPVVKATDNGTVFLAEVTDDLEDRREEIKRYLKDQGFRVLPEENGYLTYDATNLQQNINTNSTASLLYVQLVSRLRGKKILGADSCITKFQYDNVKPAGKKILLWRSPDLKMDEADMPIELKELHSSEHIRAECFEDFKTAVLQMLTIKNEEDPVEPDNRFVYICTDSIDKPYCDTKIVPRLERKNIDYSYPLLNSKDITRVRKFQDQNLLSCDAALFVYCSSDPDTVFNQLMYCRKIKTSRKLPFKIVAIYDGPPPEKEAIELGIQSIPYSYLNCRENDKYIVI